MTSQPCLPCLAAPPRVSYRAVAARAASNARQYAETRAARKAALLRAIRSGTQRFWQLRQLPCLRHMPERYVRELLAEMEREGLVEQGIYGWRAI